MPKSESCYANRNAALTTKHHKELVIAPVLKKALGLNVEALDSIDTDLLGTFTGEIERFGSMSETVYKKADLGMQKSEHKIGIASEGAYGPHPAIPFVAAGIEMIAFIDNEIGFRLIEQCLISKTNFASLTCKTIKEIDKFLQHVQFPTHAVIVRPNIAGSKLFPILSSKTEVYKGITDHAKLEQAIASAAKNSQDELARVESDMRAHLNPTRMRSIKKLSISLARRLAHKCPHCQCPGWGKIDIKKGLPCADCGLPSDMVLNEVYGCPRCSYRQDKPRADGLKSTNAENCPYCNP